MNTTHTRNGIKYEIKSSKNGRNIQGVINGKCVGLVDVGYANRLLQLFWNKTGKKEVFRLEEFKQVVRSAT